MTQDARLEVFVVVVTGKGSCASDSFDAELGLVLFKPTVDHIYEVGRENVPSVEASQE
jgi:hypothetical protein